MARKTRNTLQADFDELLSLGPTPEPTVKFPRKTKRVMVEYVFEGAVWSVSVPSADLGAVCERLTDLSNDDRIRLVSRLTDTLVMALLARSTNGKHKPKGIQAGRGSFLAQVKYAAAWTYLFCDQQQRLPVGQRHLAFTEAEKACAQQIKNWNDYSRSVKKGRPLSRERCILLTAFLVMRAYKSEWKEHTLDSDPVERPESVNSFYQTFICPRLRTVKSYSKSYPDQLLSFHNSYLRFVLQLDSE